MQTAETWLTDLLSELRARNVELRPDGNNIRYHAPRGGLTPELRAKLAVRKADVLALLTRRGRTSSVRELLPILNHVEATWKPGEWIAFRDHDGRLVTARFAGVSTGDKVNVWLADGAVRAIQPDAMALDWRPDYAEIFEERLAIMMEGGVPEDVARERAEHCTREFMKRVWRARED